LAISGSLFSYIFGLGGIFSFYCMVIFLVTGLGFLIPKEFKEQLSRDSIVPINYILKDRQFLFQLQF